MNFIVTQYDPLDEAVQLFSEHNQAPPEDREYSEDELTKLIVHRVAQHERSRDDAD
jgi:hypothetical protein